MRRFAAVLAVATLAAGLAGLARTGSAVQAAQVTIEGVASGAEENPVVTGPGNVRVRFIFDDAAKTLHYQATVNGLSEDQVTAAHIHRAAKGSNGPIVYPLSTVPFIQVEGTLQLNDADVADLKAGNFYFNAHSKENPGGFARFQLSLPAAPAAAPAALPSTGSGGTLGDSSTSWLPFAGLAALGLIGVGALVLARKRA